jgi:hypothetical protein
MDQGRGRFRWGGCLLVAACLWVAAVGVTPAAGATWTGRHIPGETERLPLFGISCPTSSLCVAVGGGNTVASSTQPTGPTSAWKVVYPGAGAIPFAPNQRQIRGIDCPSPQLCVAVTFEGLIYTTTNPAGDASAWTVTDLDGPGPNTHLYGVSCPSPNFCAASAGGAKVVTTTNPTGGAAAWTKTQLQGPMELRGISCAGVGLCVAVGDNGDGIRPEITDQALLVSSTNPLGGVWNVAPMPGQSLFGVSCPSPQLCVSGETLGNLLVSTNPTAGGGAWRQIDGGGTVQITDADCVTPSLCAVIDNNGDVLTSTNPDGGPGDWTFTNLLPFPGVEETEENHLFGASCPTQGFCAISSNGGQVFTSTDPFVVSEPSGKGRNDKGRKRKKGPKRPRTEMALRPPAALELAGRKFPVRFRFYARNRVPVRGFVCKLDRRPLKRCRSPKTYRVGLGRHVFRVRAIGSTGLRGPVETAGFRVCRPTGSHVPCKKHRPPNPPQSASGRLRS